MTLMPTLMPTSMSTSLLRVRAPLARGASDAPWAAIRDASATDSLRMHCSFAAASPGDAVGACVRDRR
jgi:hypothetical protein